MNWDVIIVGGGAAGLLCGIEAGKRGRRVVILEHNDRVGKKIKISGGGRCNFTNLHTTPENFISRNTSFHKSALARYAPSDFVSLVRRHRIPFHEKKLGQLFCDGSSDEIIRMLLVECRQAGVDIQTGCRITEVRKASRFVLSTNLGELTSDSLVIATGGLSVPKIGTSDLGYRIARQFGLRVTEVRAGLVPFTFEGDEGRMFRELTGVSVDAVVMIGKQSFHENILFTHRGLSGPAILQISSYWRPAEAVIVDLLPDVLPRRLVKACGDIRRWTLIPSGTEGFEKAEVTVGGVDTTDLSSKTMEARNVPGLYFIGEVVDVTGQLGGFNFQWAWASGFVAGQNV
jgi:predicted Rossmann fold flavoprotein